MNNRIKIYERRYHDSFNRSNSNNKNQYNKKQTWINTDKYLLCDAIVETGKTMEENGLHVWKTIIPKGQVKMGLYASFK